jgi:hypothetical protein
LSERLQEILLFCFDSLELAELLLYFGFCWENYLLWFLQEIYILVFARIIIFYY